MKEMRRVLALLLCFVMLVGYVPVGALATETEPTVAVETQPVEEVVEAAFGEAVSASEEKADSDPAETAAPTEETEVVEEIIEAVFGEEITASKPAVTPSETEPVETEAEETVPAETEAEETVPAETEAEETVPAETKAEETVPAETEAAEVQEEVEASEEAEAALTAVSADAMEAALKEAKNYVADLVKANNPPSSIVESVGTHFSWDYEKRETKEDAKYLYEWSYYNGVVFEGLDNLAEVTGNQEYAAFVESYLDAMITDGTLNDFAGYVSSYGADCYKTADLLLDYWYSTGDGEYYNVAKTLYKHLQNAKAEYTDDKNLGGNFYHSWKPAKENGYDLWLDGLYMILPFMAEYAEYFDEGELKLIVDRLTWVSENMGVELKNGLLFSHAYDADKGIYNNNQNFWGRAIGWYAAALVDVMDHMPESDQATLAAQLKKLVDGMLGYQTSDGMWRQFVNVETSTKETSVTALMGYAIMKAVNEGWLVDTEEINYTNAATNAFVGICKNALDDSGLHYICHKGAVNRYEEPTYAGHVNEGKGAGPFIMLYAEVLEHWGVEPKPETPSYKTESLTIEGVKLTGDVEDVTADETVAAAMAAVEGVGNFLAYSIPAEQPAEGETATVTVDIPEGWNTDNLKAYHINEDGEVDEIIEGVYADGKFTFKVNHFSTYAVAEGTLSSSDQITKAVTSIDSGNYYRIVSLTDTTTDRYLSNLMAPASGAGYDDDDVKRLQLTTEPHYWYVTKVQGGYTVQYGGPDGQYLAVGDLSTGNNNNTAVEMRDERTVLQMGYHAGNKAWGVWIADNGTNRYLNHHRPKNNQNTYVVGTWTGSHENNSDVASRWRLDRVVMGTDETVTLELNAEKNIIMPGETLVVTPVVKVDGIETSNYKIEWASDAPEAATVSGGTVTGKTDGSTANISATLTEVNGAKPVSQIKATFAVAVQSREIDHLELVTSRGSVVKNSPAGTDTGAKLRVVYKDGGTEEVDITLGMVSGSALDITKADTYTGLTVSYGGEDVGGFILIVNNYPGNNFPEYPNEGAVDVNKVIGDASQFQDTGVAEVQLSTSGIPIKRGVNALLIMDISNSMSWDDTDYDYADQTVVAGTNQRLNISKASAKQFVRTLLTEEDESESPNTVTVLAFAGIDGDNNTHNTAMSNDDVYQLGDLAMRDISDAEAAIDQLVKATTGGTNYDYAFQQAYALAQQLYADNGQEVHIVFMTDGAPTHYNGVYYKQRTNTDLTARMQYVDPNTGEVTYYTSTGNDRNGKDIDSTAKQNITVYYNDGRTATKNVTYNKGWSDYVINNKNGWAEKTKGLEYVAKVYSIGFGMKNGSVTQGATDAMPTLNNKAGGTYYIPYSTTKTVLEHVASSAADYYEADKEDELTALYTSLASQIREAAYDAYFVDQMGSSFDIQMASTVTKFKGTADETTITLNPRPKMSVSTYPVYTKAQVGTTVGGVNVTESMVGKRYGNPTPVETVTFNDDGTQAFSNQTYTFQYKQGDTVLSQQVTSVNDNIVVGGVIYAKNFWYNTNKQAKTIVLADGSEYVLPAETFYWNIGTIKQTEFVLSYYVYLTGAAEGEAHKGTYATNNYATLYYENYLGNDVSQDVQSPSLAWESAAVYYGFYLVDEHGRPLVNQTTGETGSFEKAIKVTQKIFHEEVLLNDVGTAGTTIQAISKNVPTGYTVYDDKATYTITIDSSKKVSGWTISNTKYVDENENSVQDTNEKIGTTYVTDYRGTESTNVTLSSQLDQKGIDYTSTTVWFAVVWGPGAIPDSVVIDYGLPVDISVLANDLFGVSGTVTGLGTEEPEGDNTFDAKSVDLNYGNAKINGSKVRYTPKTMMMNSYDRFLYEVYYDNSAQAEKQGYYYGEVTVIPATTIYYEDSFETGGITYSGTATWGIEGEESDMCQAEDRPGKFSLSSYDANNVYGFDQAYETMSQFSMGGAHMVHVDSSSYGMITFEFYGTGFDIISMTSNLTGTLAVKVMDADTNAVVKTLAVDTYYGYKYGQYYVVYGRQGETWVPYEVFDDLSELNGVPEMSAAGEDDQMAYRYEWFWKKVNTLDEGEGNYREDEEALFQVPVIKMDLNNYGHYKVQMAASYYEMYDHTFDGKGYDLFIDAVRIYNPAGTTYDEKDAEGNVTTEGNINDVIQDAYIADSEGWPKYMEVRNKIIAQGSFNPTGSTSGAIFIDRAKPVYDEDKEVWTPEYTMSDYISYGPNNEMYLAPGQAIAFSLNLGPINDEQGNLVHQNKVADVQIGLKSADGKDVKVTMGRWSLKSDGTFTCVNSTAILGTGSSTDRYFSIGNHVNKSGNTLLSIQNTGDDGVLSITNIKITFSEQPVETGSTDDVMGIDESQATAILKSFNKIQQEQMPEPLPDADLDVSIRKTSVKVGSSVVVKITTSADVDYLMVNGEKITKFSQNRQTGKRSWTATVKTEKVGDMEIEVTAYSAKGAELDADTQTIEVTEAKASLAKNVVDTIISKLFR